MPGMADNNVADCLDKETFTERHDCLQQQRQLAEEQTKLLKLSGESNSKKTKWPTPISYVNYNHKSHVQFLYNDGRFNAQVGDTIPPGWTVIKISNASVKLERNGKKIVLGYAGSESSVQPIKYSAINIQRPAALIPGAPQ
jgi:hypothetical protein